MSADNWAVCPRCKAKAEEQLRAMDIEVAEAYGKTDLEAFDQLRSERDEFRDADPDETLREDYEIWTDSNGRFFVSYGAGCAECGFKHTFRHDEQLEIGAS